MACLAPVTVIAVRPVVAAPSIATVAIAIMTVPSVGVSVRVSCCSRFGSGFGFSRPLSVIAIIAIRPVRSM